MRLIKSFFRSDEVYNYKIEQYSEIDAGLACVLFVIFIGMYSLLALAEKNFSFVNNNIILIGCVINTILIIVPFIMIKSRKQGLESLGLRGGWWQTSCMVGIILAALLFMGNCGIDLIEGRHLVDAGTISTYVVYFLLVALCEEITFRGFITPRLCAVINKQWIAVIVSGLLFTFMHFPYRMIMSGQELTEFMVCNMGSIVDWFGTHIVLSLIYSRTNSLYGAIIPHWISDLANKIVVR